MADEFKERLEKAQKKALEELIQEVSDFSSSEGAEVKERRISKKKDKPRGFAKPVTKKGKRRS
jgi:hypothetical protein